MSAPLPEAPSARRLAALVATLRTALADLRLIYAFGSVAEGTEHPGSDVDLALLADHMISPLLLFDQAAHLSELAGREVDLIDLAAASTVLRKDAFLFFRVA